ncbi:sensor histidine kinase [Lysinibacillus piscis]|uniref:histidine kinase n=1 Tax=Lysinibacillus piscis TaxID=2518931 RepID=A0ABQ5NQC3_9BACI|nr:histidine kinase [Lysinibacillus sp. KH24]GLC90539.1 sensor histidine kinase YxjM [Lysinibacillus sp. KH24]
MAYISVRISCLLLLIFIFLFHTYQVNDALPIALFICATVLCLYFILPLLKGLRFLSYSCIVLLLFSSALLSLDILYVLPLIAFFIVESAFSLETKPYIFLLGLINVNSSLFIFLQWLPLYIALLLVVISSCALLLRHYIQLTTEKGELYTALLGQYRALKRLSVEQEQLVRAEERTNIARDMHDAIGHNLTALLMQVEMLSIQNTDQALEDIKQLARQSLDDTRYAVRQLKANDTYGIQSVLHLIRRLEMESRLHMRFTIEKGVLSVPISNRQSVVLYRVLQECLTNAMKYSDSKEVEILLGRDSLQQVCFSVKNKSLEQSAIVYGFGLKNMEERLHEIGGTFHVYQTEQYFIVEGTFPIMEGLQ